MRIKNDIQSAHRKPWEEVLVLLQSIENGAEWLDRARPDWAIAIDPFLLSHTDPGISVAAAIYGSWMKACESFYAEVGGNFDHWAQEYGFDLLPLPHLSHRERSYIAWGKWLDEISKRKFPPDQGGAQ